MVHKEDPITICVSQIKPNLHKQIEIFQEVPALRNYLRHACSAVMQTIKQLTSDLKCHIPAYSSSIDAQPQRLYKQHVTEPLLFQP